MTTQIISGFNAIADRYSALIVDLWGVTHNGRELFDDAVAVFREARNRNFKIFFLSNAPRRQDTVFGQLDKFGLDRSLYDGIITSGEAAWDWIRSDEGAQQLGRNCFHLGAGEKDANMRVGLAVDFVEDIGSADFILNTGPEDAITVLDSFEDLLQTALKIQTPMVCANPDLSVFRGAAEELCAGAIAQEYERRGGTVHWFGKPKSEVYQRCLKQLDAIDPSRVLCIGDSMRTDIGGANAAGLDCLLVATGLRGNDLLPSGEQQISQAGLDSLCAEYGVAPTYVCVALKP